MNGLLKDEAWRRVWGSEMLEEDFKAELCELNHLGLAFNHDGDYYTLPLQELFSKGRTIDWDGLRKQSPAFLERRITLNRPIKEREILEHRNRQALFLDASLHASTMS